MEKSLQEQVDEALDNIIKPFLYGRPAVSISDETKIQSVVDTYLNESCATPEEITNYISKL